MSYVRFVPGFSRHPKRVKCGPVSSWLWACSVDYCMTFLTDGYIEEMAVRGLCTSITGSALTRAVDNLVAVGSWERVPGGYQVHDYLKHNASKARIERDQQLGRERYFKWADSQKSKGSDNGSPTALDIPKPNDALSLSVCLTDRKATTSKGNVAPAKKDSKTDPDAVWERVRAKLVPIAPTTAKAMEPKPEQPEQPHERET